MPRGGWLTVATRIDDQHVVAEVSDTGSGIPPEQLPRIFDKFYQADNQKSARSAGTGLGLAIAKQIVDAHGGSIVVSGREGGGSRFVVLLPASSDVGIRGAIPR